MREGPVAAPARAAGTALRGERLGANDSRVARPVGGRCFRHPFAHPRQAVEVRAAQAAKGEGRTVSDRRPKSSELARLLGDLADERLSDADRTRLLDLLRSDAKAHDYYLDYIHLHVTLARARAFASAGEFDPAPPGTEDGERPGATAAPPSPASVPAVPGGRRPSSFAVWPFGACPLFSAARRSSMPSPHWSWPPALSPRGGGEQLVVLHRSPKAPRAAGEPGAGRLDHRSGRLPLGGPRHGGRRRPGAHRRD